MNPRKNALKNMQSSKAKGIPKGQRVQKISKKQKTDLTPEELAMKEAQKEELEIIDAKMYAEQKAKMKAEKQREKRQETPGSEKKNLPSDAR